MKIWIVFFYNDTQLYVEKAEAKYDFSVVPVYADLNRYTGLDMDCTLDTFLIQEK